MGIIFREMRSSDYEQAYALWQHTPGIGLSDADSKEAVEHFLKKNSALCFIAVDQDKLIGTILCGEDGRRGYIYHLAVAEEYRQMGIGKTLVQKSLAALAQHDIQKCHLFVYVENHAGKTFWEHIGWKARNDIEVMSFNLEQLK